MKGQRQGFTLVEIMIVVTVIGLLAAIAVPTYTQAREKSMTNRCLNNLRQMTHAKDQYAFDHFNAEPSAVIDLVPDYISKEPSCVAGGSYTIGAVGEDTTCNISNHTL